MIALATMVFWLQSASQPGDIRVSTRDGLRYAWIPAGSFTMGCPSADNDCDDAEKPAHPVTIARGFWIGQTSVTVRLPPLNCWVRYTPARTPAMEEIGA